MSKILHRWICMPKILHPYFHQISTVLVIKTPKKMSENGDINTASKNFTLPPAVTALTNLTSEHTCYYSSSAEMLTLSVDFFRSGIRGKLGKGVQGICLKSCAKFPPNRTMCSRDAIGPRPYKVWPNREKPLTSCQL